MQRHRRTAKKYSPPFWLPASNYYLLVAAAAVAVFSLVWGGLHDGSVDTPLVPATLAAVIVLIASFVLREIILRSARNRFLATQRLDHSLRGVMRHNDQRDRAKITLERNAHLLREIAKKSEAAKVLGRFAEGHREVFELCDEYIAAVTRELPTVGVGSPRLAALRKGSDIAGRYHHFHLLQWAELEARSLTQEAGNRDKISGKLASAREALGVIDFALKYYPHDPSLMESQEVLKQLITSIQISSSVGKAEKAEFKGNYKLAISHFQDALMRIVRGGPGTEGVLAADKIREELVRLKQLQDKQAGTYADLIDNE